MPRCPHCQRLISVHEETCPHCRADQQGIDDSAIERGQQGSETGATGDEFEGELAEASDLVAIARFQSSAEAGYFADELTRAMGIDAEVQLSEQFHPLHASWSVSYLLAVPRGWTADASIALQQLVQQTADLDESDEDEDTTRSGSSSEFRDSLSDKGIPFWAPILITLTAGSLVYWGIQRGEQGARRAPALVDRDLPRPPDLWDIVASSDAPWVQQLDQGRGTRRLSVDPRRNVAVIEEDRNGDGRFERQWEFSRRPE